MVAPLAMKTLEIRAKTHLVLPGPLLALHHPECPLDSRRMVKVSLRLKTLLRVLALGIRIIMDFHLSAPRKEPKIQPRRNGSLHLQVPLMIKMGLDRGRVHRLNSRIIKDPIIINSHRNLNNLTRSHLVNLTGSCLLPLSSSSLLVSSSSSSTLLVSSSSLFSSPLASLSSLRSHSAPKSLLLPSMTA